MCKCDGELVDHLLLHCPVAHEMWSMLLGYLVSFGLCLRSVLGLLEYWQGKFGRHWSMGVWRVVLHCLTWSLAGV